MTVDVGIHRLSKCNVDREIILYPSTSRSIRSTHVNEGTPTLLSSEEEEQQQRIGKHPSLSSISNEDTLSLYYRSTRTSAAAPGAWSENPPASSAASRHRAPLPPPPETLHAKDGSLFARTLQHLSANCESRRAPPRGKTSRRRSRERTNLGRVEVGSGLGSGSG